MLSLARARKAARGHVIDPRVRISIGLGRITADERGASQLTVRIPRVQPGLYLIDAEGISTAIPVKVPRSKAVS